LADIIVLGCGVIGLTTALRLLEAGYAVRLVARERSPHTTSDIAAAVWYPFLTDASERALHWSRVSFEQLRDLAPDPAAGVTIADSLLLVGGDRPAVPRWHRIVEGWRPARPEELPAGRSAAVTGGYVYRVPVVRMPRYLAWLEGRVRAWGARLEQRSVTDLDALFDEARGVVNCTGLGAARLVPDPSVVPIRGQLVYVAAGFAPRVIQDAAGGEEVTYIIPRPDCTVLGGTAEVGQWDLAVRPETAEAIRARCLRLVPELARADVLGHAVGLRPGRPAVRLEVEQRPRGRLVHNYGHGGAGVTLSWGCAADVVGLMSTPPS
jgi:D-amino-acid oxidase